MYRYGYIGLLLCCVGCMPVSHDIPIEPLYPESYPQRRIDTEPRAAGYHSVRGTTRYVAVNSAYEASMPIDPSEEYDGELYEVGYESSAPLSPEPYRKDSAQPDPELLGPATTMTATSATVEQRVNNPQPMNDERCRRLLGAERYARYLSRYGSEQGVLRRCRVIARTH